MGDEDGRAYFYRLISLIVDYGTEILIQKFQRLLPKGFTFKTYLELKDQIIQGLRRKHVLTKVQFEILQKDDPKLEECDITLLTTLLQNIFNTQLKPPKNGWQNSLHENDTSDGAYVIRLRMIRNKYTSHETKTFLTKEDFETQWSNVTDILKNLAAPFTGNEEIVFIERIDNFLVRELDVSAIERALDESRKHSNIHDDSNIQKILKNTTNIDQTTTNTCQKVDDLAVNFNKFVLQSQEMQVKEKDMQMELLKKIQQHDRTLADHKQILELQPKQEEQRKTLTEVIDTTENIQTEQTPAKKEQAEGKSSIKEECTDSEPKEDTFAIGNIVQIIDSLDVVEQLQEGHGGFTDSMEKCVGKYGKVMKIDKDGDLRIKFGFPSGSHSWAFNPLCCAKVPVPPQADVSQLLGFKTHDFAVGDVVKIIESANDMERLQDGHGGFNQKMKLSLGKLGRIIKIDDDGDLYVKAEPRKWLLNHECCIKVTDESLIAKAPVIDSDDNDDDMLSIDDLVKLKRKLSLLKDLVHEDSSTKTITIDNGTSLSLGDEVQIMEDLETVKQLQEGHGGWVDDMKSSLGKIGIVKRFLEGGNGYLVHVRFDTTKWAFNPLCCSKIDKSQPEPSECQLCMGQSTGHTHIEKFIKRMEDILGILGVVSFSKETDIFKELNKKKTEDTKTLKEKLDKNPYLVNAKYKDVGVLQLACYLGKIEVIKCLMERNVDLQAKFDDGNTALHSATYGQSSKVMSLLLEKGVNPDEKNKEGFTSLHIAVQNGSVICAKVLLDNNASVNIRDNEGNTPMHACTAKTELIDVIFSVSNADFGIENSKGQNVLQYLSVINCYRAAEIVCEKKPDIVNVQHKKLLYTALHICAKWNHELVAKVLLKYGGDPNVINERKSAPLHLAVKEGHHRFVELLVQNGCKLDAQDENGNTALHLAQIFQVKSEKRDVAYKITEILINHRANVEIKNNEGKLPVDLCNDKKMKELFQRDFFSNWDPMEGTKSITVTLSENKHQDEYQDVCKQFQETMPNAKIFNIKRVQNKQLLDMYKTAKDHMENSHTAQNINERHLFHGTQPDLVDGICTKKTDPRHSGSLDHPLGEGAYYATKAEFANKLTKASDDQHRFMILCSVLAGRWILGQPSYVNAPPIDPADPNSDVYDSCVDDVIDPTMFCVFHQNQFYPKYIIEYADIEESSNDQ